MRMLIVSCLSRFGFSGSAVTRMALALAAVVGLGAFGPAAEPPAARTACIPSVLRLCPDAALTGNREGAKRCLLRNLQKASPSCQAAVKAVGDAKDAARESN